MSYSQNRGQECENIVSDYLIHKGWVCLAKRKKFSFGELDLLFVNEKYVLAIEVKSLSSYLFYEHRISYKQKKRLKNILLFLVHNKDSILSMVNMKNNQDVLLMVAYVDSGNKIKFVEVADLN